MIKPTNTGASQVACDIVNETLLCLDGFAGFRQSPDHLILVAEVARIADRVIKGATVTETKLIATIRGLAFLRPGFKYASKVGRTIVDYHDGGDSRYPDARGCIVGQALRAIGGSRYLPVDGLSTECPSELGIPEETEAGGLWLDDVQQFESEGYGWATCLDMADAAQRGNDPYNERELLDAHLAR